MNSEFNGRPEQAARSEAQFWRSMEELLPVFERGGDPAASWSRIRTTSRRTGRRGRPDPRDQQPLVTFLYCAPHTFHMGNDAPGIIDYAGDLLTNVHVADSFDHTGSSGLRYIVNPPGSPVRVHQHLDIGQGEVDFDELFASLAAAGFDGTITTCVFAWEERARESSTFMRENPIYGGAPPARSPDPATTYGGMPDREYSDAITHLIGGSPWNGAAERTSKVYNPATGEVTGELDLASAATVDEVVGTRQAASPDWAQTSLAKRTQVLFAFRELVNQRQGARSPR